MIRISSRASPIVARAAVVSAALLLAACAPQYSPPQQVRASNPSVTYKYHSDQELLQANQNAMTFCSQYRSTAQTANIIDSPDGSKTVVFECMAMAPAATPQPPLNPNLAYTYHTDQGLLDASRNAGNYCANEGSQRALATATTDTDGTKTVTFRCVPQ